MEGLRDLIGCRLYKDMDLVGTSAYVFDTNCKDLEAFLESLEHADDWLAADEERLNAFFLEVTRLLHNTVAGAMSLREHTKTFRQRWYVAHSDIARVQAKASGTFDVPAAQFVQQLRVFMQHRGVPERAVVSSWDEEGGRQSFVLPRDTLLEARGWPPGAQSFLEHAPEQIDVLGLFRTYRESVDAFYSWFENDIRATHEEVLAECDEARREYLQLSLEDNLKIYLSAPPDFPGLKRLESVFHNTMTSEEIASLDEVEQGSQRAELAIDILRRMRLNSDAVEQSVRRLYAERAP
jgi:hypothetical protein